MSRCVDCLDEKFYPSVDHTWGDVNLRQTCFRYIRKDSTILDLGAGAGIIEQMNFRGSGRMVVGLDLDPRVKKNPYLDEAFVANGEQMPFEAEAFDTVVSNNVLEHLANPTSVFAEVARVLRPGGRFIFKTPNSIHYMPLIARLSPQTLHVAVKKRLAIDAADTFATYYRANSRSRIERLGQEAGLQVDEIHLIESRPEYTRIFCPLYLFGIAWERLVNRFDALARFRILIIAVLSKPAGVAGGT